MVRAVPAVRDTTVQVLAAVGPREMVRAVVLAARGTLVTGASCVPASTGLVLGADADSIADLYVSFGFVANAHHRADDFVAHAAGVDRGTLTAC